MKHLLKLLAVVMALSPVAHAQAIAPDQTPAIRVCPGAFPTDLTSTDCRYTFKERSLDFVAGSATDQAAFGAIVFGLGAQVIQSPSEWKRTWDGYGRRVGSRYTQAVGKGAAQYLIGLMVNDDPRFLAYRSDPRVVARRRDAVCALNQRMTHGSELPCTNPAPKSL